MNFGGYITDDSSGISHDLSEVQTLNYQYFSLWLMDRRDFMISAFPQGPAASGRGLCDIDKVLLGVVNSCHMSHVSKNWEVSEWGKYTDNLDFSVLIPIGKFQSGFVLQGLPIFWHVMY